LSQRSDALVASAVHAGLVRSRRLRHGADMEPAHGVGATVLQHETSDWTPLVQVIGDELARWFMWMCEIQLANGAKAHAYKHRATRRYLWLTADGRALASTVSGRYVPIACGQGVRMALEGWERLRPPPGTLAHSCTPGSAVRRHAIDSSSSSSPERA